MFKCFVEQNISITTTNNNSNFGDFSEIANCTYKVTDQQ